jgi:hypothetical protein
MSLFVADSLVSSRVALLAKRWQSRDKVNGLLPHTDVASIAVNLDQGPFMKISEPPRGAID